MKKTLLTIFTAVLSISFANAQCNPNVALADSSFGLWPDSLATVYTCLGCGDATRVVDLVTFVDTVMVVSGDSVTIYIDAFKVAEVRNIPSGMTYGTNVEAGATAEAPYGIWYNGGDAPDQTTTQGCVYINGPEAEWIALAATDNYGTGRGAVQLEIDVDVHIVATDNPLLTFLEDVWMSGVPVTFGGGLITVEDYWLVAQESAVGIVEVDANRFMLTNNYPNPFTGVTSITFNSPYNKQGLEFNVYSILGNRIDSQRLDAVRGSNTVEFDGTGLASGLYVYTLTDGTTTLTHKMNVK